MGLAMDQIYRALIGDAGANLRAGKPVSGADVANSALTVGLNALPIPAAAVPLKAADKALAKRLAMNIFKKPDIAIVAPDTSADDIIKEGFKSTYENQLRNSASGNYMDRRTAVEEAILGIPPSTLPAQRPVYGSVVNPKKLPEFILSNTPGVTGKTLRALDPGFNRQINENYGRLAPVVFRSGSEGLTGTMTVGDSFNPVTGIAYGLNAADAPKAAAIELVQALSKNPRSVPYVEAQIARNVNPIETLKSVDLPISQMRFPSSAQQQTGEYIQKLQAAGRPGTSSVIRSKKDTTAIDRQNMLDRLLKDAPKKLKKADEGLNKALAAGDRNEIFNRQNTKDALQKFVTGERNPGLPSSAASRLSPEERLYIPGLNRTYPSIPKRFE